MNGYMNEHKCELDDVFDNVVEFIILSTYEICAK